MLLSVPKRTMLASCEVRSDIIFTAEKAAKPACDSCACEAPTAVASANGRTEETRTKRQLQQITTGVLYSGDCDPGASFLA